MKVYDGIRVNDRNEVVSDDPIPVATYLRGIRMLREAGLVKTEQFAIERAFPGL